MNRSSPSRSTRDSRCLTCDFPISSKSAPNAAGSPIKLLYLNPLQFSVNRARPASSRICANLVFSACMSLAFFCLSSSDFPNAPSHCPDSCVTSIPAATFATVTSIPLFLVLDGWEGGSTGASFPFTSSVRCASSWYVSDFLFLAIYLEAIYGEKSG